MPIFRRKGYTIFAILLLSRIKWSNHLSQTQNIWRSIINIHLVDWCPTVSLWLLVYLISSIKAFLILHRHLSLRRFHYWDLSLAIQQLCNRFPKIQFSLDKWKTLKNFTFLHTTTSIWFHATCVESRKILLSNKQPLWIAKKSQSNSMIFFEIS